MWVVLILSIKRLKSKKEKTEVSQKRHSASRLYHRNSAWVSCRLAYFMDFKLASLHNYMSQLLKINLFLSPFFLPSLSPSLPPPPTPSPYPYILMVPILILTKDSDWYWQRLPPWSSWLGLILDLLSLILPNNPAKPVYEESLPTTLWFPIKLFFLHLLSKANAVLLPPNSWYLTKFLLSSPSLFVFRVEFGLSSVAIALNKLCLAIFNKHPLNHLFLTIWTLSLKPVIIRIL